MMTLWVSKDSEFYFGFKNINLPWWQNASKKLLQKHAKLGLIPKMEFFGITL
jgi:hypothetical protein